jgi:hypothetical protein
MMKIDKAFGLHKADFEKGRPLYTVWPGMQDESAFDLANLGDWSLQISKNLGDVYIDKIFTNKWVVIGKGTRLHCDDLHAGEAVIRGFEGYMS